MRAPSDPMLPVAVAEPASGLAPALSGRVRMIAATAGWGLPDYVTETFGDLAPTEWWSSCRSGRAMARILPAGEFGSPVRRRLAAVCAALARLALPAFEAARPGDDRPRRAIELAEAYARGEDIGRERLQVAGDGVRAAGASTACAAAYATADADAAYAVDAVSAVSYWACVPGAAGMERVPAECADIVRRHYPEGVAWALAEKQKEVTQ